MLELQTLLTYLSLISIPVGIFYYVMTLRNQSRTRRTQLFMEIYNKFNDSVEKTQGFMELVGLEFDGYDDFMERYGPDRDPRIWASLYHNMMFFEGIGILVKRGLIDVEMVEDFMSGVIMNTWGKFGPIHKEIRVRLGHPTWAEEYEYLYNQIRLIYERQHGVEAVRRYVGDG